MRAPSKVALFAFIQVMLHRYYSKRAKLPQKFRFKHIMELLGKRPGNLNKEVYLIMWMDIKGRNMSKGAKGVTKLEVDT